MRLTDENKNITEDRALLKVIGYALDPTVKTLKLKKIGKAFGIKYVGGSNRIKKSLETLLSKNLIEIYHDRRYDKIYTVKDRKGLEEFYHEILWKASDS